MYRYHFIKTLKQNVSTKLRLKTVSLTFMSARKIQVLYQYKCMCLHFQNYLSWVQSLHCLAFLWASWWNTCICLPWTGIQSHGTSKDYFVGVFRRFRTFTAFSSADTLILYTYMYTCTWIKIRIHSMLTLFMVDLYKVTTCPFPDLVAMH